MNDVRGMVSRMTQSAGGTLRRRPLSLTAAAILVLGFLPAVIAVLPGPGAATARADEVTVSQNSLRTGWDPNEPGLTPTAVSSSSFGELFSTPVNGQVYGQPLVVGSTVVVATENDRVYGLNAATGTVNWSISLGTPWANTTCNDLTPDIGVTGGPVHDPASGTVYLVAVTMVNSSPAYYLYGITATTGAIAEKVHIYGSPTNDSSITFNAAQQWERPGLLLMNGWVYAAFGSHCDNPPYVGFVAGINVSTKAKTLWSDETGVTDNQAGIWQSGGGLMSDGPGRIFFASGNGVSPAPGPGTSPPGQLAESVVQLAVQSNGSLAAQDFFSPKNATTLDSEDLDLGSGSPVGLPFGTNVYPNLLVQGTKDGRIYVLDRGNLGGREQGTNGGDATVRTACCYAGLWGHPAAFADTTTLTASNWNTANDFIYYVAKNDYLREMKWGVDSTGRPYQHTIATSSFTFGYTSGSPVVTSNSTDPSSAIVWVVGTTGSSGANGTLYAFGGVPASTCTSAAPCTLNPIWSAPIGTASKFSVPATNGGRVYVGTRDGHVLGFGVKPTTIAAPLSGAAPTTFGQTPVGGAVTKKVTVTASAGVTVSGVSATSATGTDPFTVGQVTETVNGGTTQVPVIFPVALSKGDALHAPVTFTPDAPGGAAGAVSFDTQAAHLPKVSVPLSGDGTQTGLYATPGSVQFALVGDASVTDVPVGIAEPRTVEITNGGTSPQTVSSVRPPAAPFTATGLPTPGTIINPGQSLTVQITFAPQQAGPAAGSLTVTGDSGTTATVDLSGTGVPPVSQFTASPAAVNIGPVHPGQTATATIHMANSGNQPVTVVNVAPLRSPFHAPYPVARRLVVNPGENLAIPVTFTPDTAGTFSSVYRLTWADRLGTHTLTVPLTGSVSLFAGEPVDDLPGRLAVK